MSEHVVNKRALAAAVCAAPVFGGLALVGVHALNAWAPHTQKEIDACYEALPETVQHDVAKVDFPKKCDNFIGEYGMFMAKRVSQDQPPVYTVQSASEFRNLTVNAVEDSEHMQHENRQTAVGVAGAAGGALTYLVIYSAAKRPEENI